MIHFFSPRRSADRDRSRTWLGRSLDGLPSREQIDRMIARETARAERSGQPFSVVLFRVKGGRDGGSRRVSVSERRLALTLLRRVRLTDEVGWFDERHLCVLLPDTAAGGARAFTDKLCDEVAAKAPRPLASIYTWPGDEPTDPAPGRGDEARRTGRRGGTDRPNGSGNGNGRGLTHGRSRIFGWGGGDLNGPHGPGPVWPAGNGDDWHLAESASGRGGLALLGPPAGSRLATLAVPAVAPPRPAPAADPEPTEPAGQPGVAVQSLHALLARPMPRWKRALDVLGAAVGLTLLAPLFAVVAAAIRLTSPGPAVFTQKRCGLGGRVFTIYKFRTMCADAEAKKKALRHRSEQDGPAFKLTDDPRITRVGHLLRKTSIDELPQLWNVLKGDMSLVGPRPLPVDESRGCQRWQKRRLDVTPGLTCIWQIEGRSQVTFAEWVRMDVKYMRRLTPLHDLSILFKTIPAVLLRKGAR